MERDAGSLPPAAPSTGHIARAMTWAAAGNAVSQAMWFGSLIVLGALLPPASFGTVALGMLVTSAAIRLMEAGTHGSIVVRSELHWHELRRDLAFNVLNAAVLTALILIAAGPMIDTFGEGGRADVLRWLTLAIPLYALAIVPLAVLERKLEFKRRVGVQAGSMGIASIVAIVLGIAGAGVWALVVRQLIFYGLQPLLGWLLARELVPRGSGAASERSTGRRDGANAFLVFAVTDFVVFNADYLIVGALTDAERLGLYSLAFTIAFAPTKQISTQIGLVLFPAAARTDPETLRGRTLNGLRLFSALMLPIIPAAIALAPVLIPAVLGDEWRGMIVSFQLLIVVGIFHGVTNVIGETLAGTGHMKFRAAVNVPWAVAMLAALALLVDAYGINGAGWAHLALYAPVVVIYFWHGSKLIGLEPARTARAVAPIVIAVLIQGAVTAGVAYGLDAAGVDMDAAAVAGAVAGLIAVAAVIATRERELMARGKRLFSAAAGR